MRQLLVALLSFINTLSFSQVTTSGIRGRIAVEGAEQPDYITVQAVHLPTGTTYTTYTQKGGNYTLPNLHSGGPYTVKVSSAGFLGEEVHNLTLNLGSFFPLDLTLQPALQSLSTVMVSGRSAPLQRKTGASTTITKEQLDRLPTLSRSLQDFTRLSPQANGNSLAGSNYRYNNLNVDGAALNDAFGFTEPASGAGGSQATGTPGSLAKTQPISLETIQEVQVETAPYNVTLGNFTGGSINAVTRSGTNTFSGSLFLAGRNQLLTGGSADKSRQPLDNFYDYHSGGRFGGPLIKNKLFYFGAVEAVRRLEPVAFAPGRGSAIPYGLAKDLYDSVKVRYGYDLGSFEEVQLQMNNNKFFGRLDWNATPVHKLSLRHNYVTAFADYGERTANVLNFGSQGYRHFSRTGSTILEAKSNFSNRLSNNFILGYTQTADHRDIKGELFPHIEITYNTANTIYLGAYREAAVYGLKLKTWELTDNLTFYRNRHTITAGTHNEHYSIDYRFLTAFNGRWAYRSVEDFYAERPSRIRGVYNFQNNDYAFNRNNPSAKFRVVLLSEYLQDEIAVSKHLRLTLGLRLDHAFYPDREPVSPAVKETKGLAAFRNATDQRPRAAPRAGFNWQPSGNPGLTLRGGSGIFNGRMPFAWLAYPYYNNGSKYGNIDFRPSTPVTLEGDVAALAARYQPGKREINLLDNNFKLPQVWRSSLGLDLKTKNGWSATLEYLYTRTLKDVLFQTINLKDSTGSLQGTGDRRTVYLGTGDGQKLNPAFTNVFLLTNTDRGYRYQVSASVAKKVGSFHFSASYTFGESKDLSNGVRVSPQANWEFNQTILPNAPRLAYSNFDLRHRTISFAQYTRQGGRSSTTITAVYSAQSGAPFTYTYIGDINRDGSPNNDLIYVPRSFEESNLAPIRNTSGTVVVSAQTQWEQLNNYIEKDSYLRSRRGRYAERNGARTPWNNQLDMKAVHTLRVGKESHPSFFSLSLDIFNLSNLISHQWGRQYYVPNILNSSYQLLTVAKGSATAPPELHFSNPVTTPWQYDPILSRSQGLITLRYTW